MAETVEGFGELAASGFVGLLGVGNHWARRVERAQALALGAELPGYEVLQYHHSYLRQRSDPPGRWMVRPGGKRRAAELCALVTGD